VLDSEVVLAENSAIVRPTVGHPEPRRGPTPGKPNISLARMVQSTMSSFLNVAQAALVRRAASGEVEPDIPSGGMIGKLDPDRRARPWCGPCIRRPRDMSALAAGHPDAGPLPSS
jgi:hypothetical protein